MNNTNAPTPQVENEPAKNPNNPKNLIIGLLIAAVVIMGGFLIFNNSKSSDLLQAQQTEVTKATTEKSELQSSFDASLARLDSMSTTNADMKKQYTSHTISIAS